MIEALLLAVGLAMDATAVAVARGARSRTLLDRDLWRLPLLFGLFQAGMSAVGWQGASWTARYLDAWDHWIAFALLSLVGLKMLREAWAPSADDAEDGAAAQRSGEAAAEAASETPNARASTGDRAGPPHDLVRASLGIDVSLALATSLDAAAAGVSVPALPLPPLITIACIGVVTTALAAAGFALGWRVGNRFGRGATALGGVMLLGIGARILWLALAAG
jgi:manganese efflux pump family protein